MNENYSNEAEMAAYYGIETETPQLAEEQTIAQPQHQPQEQHYEEPRQHQPQHQGIPDVYEDPLAHFHGRTAQLEHQAQSREVMGWLERDDRNFASEVADAQEAFKHLEDARIKELERLIPDGQQGDLYAHRHGLPSAAHARAAQLNLDRQHVVAYAAQNGMSPAAMYYKLAVERAGYAPNIAMTRTDRAKLLEVVEKGGQEDYELAMRWWRQREADAEQNRRR